MIEPRKRRRWLKRLVFLLGFLVLSLIGFAVCEHLRGRSMLTRRVAQLKAAGEELSVTALLPQPVEQERNAFTFLTTLTNRTESILTNASSGPPSMKFAEPGKILAASKMTEWDSGEGETNDWDWLAPKLIDSRELIAQLHAATSLPEYSCGFDYNKGFLDFQIGPLHTVKQAAQVLSAATIYDLHRRDFTAAHSNLCALVRLVVMQEPEPLVICQLV